MKTLIFFKLLIISTFIVLMGMSCNNAPSDPAKSNPADSLQLKDTLTEISPDSLFILLEALETDSILQNASFAYKIYNISQDSLLASFDENRSLVPASTMKLFTSAAALRILGPQTRFRTVLSYDGKISGNILDGNIYIVGGGDPAFGSAIYNNGAVMHHLASEIAALGVDSITGQVIADPRIFSPDEVPYTWPHGEINSAYAAPASGLSVFDNTFTLEVRLSDMNTVTSSAGRTTPAMPAMTFRNLFYKSSETRENLIITGNPGSNTKIIRGGFPAGVQSVRIEAAIPDPPFMAAYALNNALREAGIRVAGTPVTVFEKTPGFNPGTRTSITSVASPDVQALVNQVNMFSNNLFAESLIKHIGLRRYGSGDTESGCSAVTNFLSAEGLDVNGFYMFDGSGLSRFNAVTAAQLTGVLLLMYKSEHFNVFYNSLSTAGQAGTLKKLCVGSTAQDQIMAKSGTMSRVKSYAGYALALNGDTLAFALIANNFKGPAAVMTNRFENIMIKMVEYGSQK